MIAAPGYSAWIRYWDGKQYTPWGKWADHPKLVTLYKRLAKFLDWRAIHEPNLVYSGVILPKEERPFGEIIQWGFELTLEEYWWDDGKI